MISFEKYHGCGNNFVIVNERDVKHLDYASLAKKMCDVSTGIGADGLMVVVEKPLTMLFYNCDGSEAPMCGNGIRCFANYAYHYLTRDKRFTIETLAGPMHVEVKGSEDFRVEINMGKPNWDASLLKLSRPMKNTHTYTLEVLDKTFTLHSVFLGTIHTVVFCNLIIESDVEKYGQAICEHPLFKEKTNVNFVRVVNRGEIEVLTYERGVGITKACGTGCCASVLFAHLLKFTNCKVDVRLPLGTLKISLKNDVFMDGPAKRVAIGQFEEGNL